MSDKVVDINEIKNKDKVTVDDIVAILKSKAEEHKDLKVLVLYVSESGNCVGNSSTNLTGYELAFLSKFLNDMAAEILWR